MRLHEERPREQRVNVAVLSGGVGGARFLRGLIGVVEPSNVAIVGNVADDLKILGLHVSPDLDSILYALAVAPTKSAAGGAPMSHGARSRPSGSSAAKRGSRSVTATSACTSFGRSCCATARRSRR